MTGSGPGTLIPPESDSSPLESLPAAGSEILSREEFETQLAQALECAQATASALVVLMFEVSGIGRINRAFGYRAGKAVLEELRGQLRRSQGANVVIAQFTEGRFVALCENISGEAGGLRIGSELVEEIRTPRFIGGLQIRLSTSVGVSIVGEPHKGPEQLLRDVDAAMQAARRRGSNRIEIFRPEARRRIIRQLQFEADLGTALERDELELHFQPIVSVHDSETIAIESLLRWRHPERGLIPPDQFIPAAEKSGLIMDIGDWMLAEVCTRAARWTEEAPSFNCPPVSINISALQLGEGRLEDRLSAALIATELPPSAIILEITESSAMEIQQGPLDALEALKRIGVKVHLDDFGTGYSSLAWLARLPIDGLKLDRAFVSGLSGPADPAPIFSAVVDMGRAFGLTIVAEGIETSDQLAAVKAVGVDAVQGFFIARPAPAATPMDVESLVGTAGRAAVADPPPEHEPTSGEQIGLSEAARLIGVSASTMRRYADHGEVPVTKTTGGHRRFRRRDVSRFAHHLLGEPPLTPRELPSVPLTQIGELLSDSGASLTERVQRKMYQRGRAGWFATPQGRTRTSLWLDSFGRSVTDGSHREAIEMTASYLELALLAGASTAECVRFLTQLGQAAGLEALRSGDCREEVRGWQRLMTAATESFLERLDQ